MALTSTIIHEAIITRLLPETGEMYVSVADRGAEDCSSCAAAAICRKGGGGELKVKMPSGRKYALGKRIRIQADRALHHKAVALMLVLPCMMLLLPIVALCAMGVKDWIALLVGLVACSLTYLILWCCRKQLSGRLNFFVIDDD